jgi:hypothetical protein
VKVGQSSPDGLRRDWRDSGALLGPDPKLLLVFVSHAYPLIQEFVDAVMEIAGDVPVVGCTGAGEIGPGPLSNPSQPGAVVIGLGGDFDVTTSYRTDFNQRPRQVGEEVAAELQPLPDRLNRVVIMLTDSLAGDQQELIRGAYGVLGATVPLVVWRVMTSACRPSPRRRRSTAARSCRTPWWPRASAPMGPSCSPSGTGGRPRARR